MTGFQSFNSLNGWVMPGSGDFFVDECGDLWVPCVCNCCNGEGDDDTAAGSGSIETESVAPLPADTEEDDFVTIRIPKAWLRPAPQSSAPQAQSGPHVHTGSQ